MKKYVSFFMILIIVVNMFTSISFAENADGSNINNDEITWELSGGTLTILGNGDMENYGAYGDVPWLSYFSSIKKVIISEGITNIGPYAFFACNNLREVSILGEIEAIGKSAFFGCSSLTTFKVPSTVKTIGEMAFSNCDSLTSIIIEDGVKNICNSAFKSCVKLQKINVPDSVESVGILAFSDCISLKQVTLSNKLKTISRGMFKNCQAIESIELPECVTKIEGEAFENCKNLKNVCIPSGVKSIRMRTFYGCESMESLFVGEGITSIEIYAMGFTDDPLTGESNKKIENFKICGYKNTKAERYAISYDMPFESKGIYFSENAQVVYDNSKKQYNEKEITPEVTVTYEDNTLKENVDYIIKYEDNILPGTASIIIEGMGEYVGTIVKKFEIVRCNVYYATVDNVKDVEYTGKKLEPSLSVKANGRLLEVGVDYIVTYENNINVGYANAIVQGIGNYSGTYTKKFKIVANISKATINVKDCYYGDISGQLAPNLSVVFNGKTLIVGTDYYIAEHKNNKNVGTSTITIQGIGFYYGKVYKTYNIKKKSIVGSKVTLDMNRFIYDGAYKTTYVNVKVLNKTSAEKNNSFIEGLDLEEGKDFKVSFVNNKNPGTATVTITGINNFTGTITKNFSILPAKPSSVKTVLYGYDDVKVSWSKINGVTGYVVYYKKSNASKYTKLCTTSETSVKKANLADGVKYTFKIVPYITEKGIRFESIYSKSSSIYTLKKISTPKVSRSSSKKVKVSWSNINGETGYQISKSTSKNKTCIVTTYKTTTGKSKVISVARKKTYYYKVRAYKTVSGKKIYGPWSSVKKYKLK